MLPTHHSRLLDMDARGHFELSVERYMMNIGENGLLTACIPRSQRPIEDPRKEPYMYDLHPQGLLMPNPLHENWI